MRSYRRQHFLQIPCHPLCFANNSICITAFSYRSYIQSILEIHFICVICDVKRPGHPVRAVFRVLFSVPLPVHKPPDHLGGLRARQFGFG